MKTALLALALVACGGVAPSALDDSAAQAPVATTAIVCDLGAHGGRVACDPDNAWWFVASSDGVQDTFASCARDACPRTVACFVGAEEGYCR